MSANKLLSRLQGVKQVSRRREWWALCPVHGEQTPSLHITEKDDGSVMMHCFGCGCNGAPVIDALGLSLSDLFGERPYTERDSGDAWNPTREPSKSVFDAMQDEIYRLRAKT
jgi:hypothetical protein